MTFGPVVYDAPPVNPAPNGLWAATSWTVDETPRWFADGVEVRPFNYGGAFGVWEAPFDVAEADLTEDDLKTGDRPTILDPFVRVTVWGYDRDRIEVTNQVEADNRAAQNLRLNAPVALEQAFAERVVSDSPLAFGVADIVEAVGWLEMKFGVANTQGFIHASPALAAAAAQNNLIVRSGAALKTPLGHTWVFGGGYEAGLGLKVAGTSQPFGWRTNVEVFGKDDLGHSRFGAVAEQSFAVGYEAVIGCADLDS